MESGQDVLALPAGRSGSSIRAFSHDGVLAVSFDETRKTGVRLFRMESGDELATYDSEGVNFEGPAPRPMDRAHVEMDAEGQIVVDIARLYKWPKGETNQFNDPGAFIPL